MLILNLASIFLAHFLSLNKILIILLKSDGTKIAFILNTFYL